MSDHDRLLTIEQAADRLAMRPVTLRMWASARKIARVKIGRAVRIPESEINKIVERGLIPALPERPSDEDETSPLPGTQRRRCQLRGLAR